MTVAESPQTHPAHLATVATSAAADEPAVIAVDARIPISVVIPTLNEAVQIENAVQWLAWADEVIVVDGGSTDNTADLARAAGATVLVCPGLTIGRQRNAGIEIARNTWILALDADERVSPELQQDLATAISAGTHAAYSLRFQNYFLGQELRHGAYRNDWHVRLFQRDRRYSGSNVHERLEDIPNVGRLVGQVIHRPFRDFPHYVAKVIKYSRWGAQDVAARGKRVTLSDVTLRPGWRFFRDYVIYGGFLDGIPGFLVAAFAGVGTLMKYSYVLADRVSNE